MNTISKVITGILASSLFLMSCQSDDDNQIDSTLTEFDNGIIVSHEGSTVSGSTSFVSNDLNTTVNGIYNRANNEELGVFQQSIGFNGDKAYIIVDNANSIGVVDRISFKKETIINEGLITPRFISFYEGKGYVSNWGDTGSETDDFIAVVNLTTNTVESTIPVALGPEQLIIKGSKLYVAHKGAFGINNRISVIDLTSNTIVEIETLFLPDEMVLVGNDLWVSCEGTPSFRPEGETIGAIVKIDTTTDTVTETYEFELGEHTSQMVFENGILYYAISGKIYAFDISTSELPTAPITEAAINGMSINEGKLYTVDALDFASSGSLNVYDITTKIWSTPVSVGVVPAKIYFN